MRALLLAASALVAGCLAESAGGPAAPGVNHPMANAANATTCAAESSTGSHVNRTVCREPPSAEAQAASALWRSTQPANPFRGGSQATDTPGLRVYH